MLCYEGDYTERALRRRVPPAATPLGLAMLRAGCRWFKDWYFPEAAARAALNAGNRCANAHSCRSRSTVGSRVIGSIGA
jgi:hypothetical protein